MAGGGSSLHSPRVAGFPMMRRMRADDHAVLYRELAKLTGADFHLDRSLDLLLAQELSTRQRRFVAGLRGGLEAGLGVAAALRRLDGVPELDLALIEAGERSGRLTEAFGHLETYYAAMTRAAAQMRAALVYPLLLLHLAPLLPQLPHAMAQGADWLPRLLLSLAGLWTGLLAFAAAGRWLAARAQASATLDRWLCRLPLLGPVRRHWALARFCLVAHAGLLAALRVPEISRLAGAAAQSGRLRAAGEHAAVQLAEGRPWAEALGGARAFPKPFVQAVATAEHIGGLDREMQRWAALETETARQALARLAEWLPRLAYGLVVALVVWRLFAMIAEVYAPLLAPLQEL